MYQWDHIEKKWELIGSVSEGGAASSEGKTTFQGKSFDYVFDVDLNNDGVMRKLPCNEGDNPYYVAQQFIWRGEKMKKFIFYFIF